MIGVLGISCEVALKWMSRDPTDNKSTLAQVMNKSKSKKSKKTLFKVGTVKNNERVALICSKC